MADAPILGAAKTKKVKLDDVAFGARFNGPLVHESVRAELNARRQGTASTKTRGNVRGGGVAFGPQPRSYTFKVNRKEQRAALRSALSLHAERRSIAILDPATFTAPKTSQAFDLLEDWAQDAPTLVVLVADESAAALSFRNIARVAVLDAAAVGVTDLLAAASLLVSRAALEQLTARAKQSEPERTSS